MYQCVRNEEDKQQFSFTIHLALRRTGNTKYFSAIYTRSFCFLKQRYSQSKSLFTPESMETSQSQGLVLYLHVFNFGTCGKQKYFQGSGGIIRYNVLFPTKQQIILALFYLVVFPLNRFLDNLTFAQLIKKFTALYRTQKLITMFTRIHHQTLPRAARIQSRLL